MKISNFDLRDNPLQNFIINGNMDIAQRGTSFTGISSSGTYTLDRWRYTKSASTAVYTISQDTDVPTLAQSGVLSNHSLRMNLTTPDTSIAAGDLIIEEYLIEGHNWRSLAQKPFTLSFWVKATLPGTYCVAFRSSGVDRCYVSEYTINTANTWEKKTINVSASPSTGTWNYSTGVGLRVGFVIAAGTTFQGIANTWNTSNTVATSNQINGANTGATDFRIAQVMLNVGTEAAPFTRTGGTIGGEFALCQRYYEKSSTNLIYYSVSGGATNNIYWKQDFKVEKRVIPSVVFTGTSYSNVTGVASVQAQGTEYFAIVAVGTAATTRTFLGFNNDAFWTADAEL